MFRLKAESSIIDPLTFLDWLLIQPPRVCSISACDMFECQHLERHVRSCCRRRRSRIFFLVDDGLNFLSGAIFTSNASQKQTWRDRKTLKGATGTRQIPEASQQPTRGAKSSSGKSAFASRLHFLSPVYAKWLQFLFILDPANLLPPESSRSLSSFASVLQSGLHHVS